MSFTAIDLSQIDAPNVVESLDFETILQAIKDDFAERAPDYADLLDLESEPLVKLMESAAYLVLNIRQRVNDASRAVMLAYAAGTDLDNLAALFGVTRSVIEEADAEADPSIDAIFEDDESLRSRVQLSLEGYSAAGPVGAYAYFAKSADPAVKDVNVSSPSPGQVLVTILSSEGDGTPSQSLLDTVDAALNDEDVRPLTDEVLVEAATIIPYQVDAQLILESGPDPEVVRAASEASLLSYLDASHALGTSITMSGLYAALHQSGVQNVIITAPANDIECAAGEAPYCSSILVAGVAS